MQTNHSNRQHKINYLLQMTDGEFKELVTLLIPAIKRRNDIKDRYDFINYLDSHNLWHQVNDRTPTFSYEHQNGYIDKNLVESTLETQSASQRERASGSFIYFVVLLFSIVLLVALSISAYYLAEPWTIVAVFLVFITCLLILLPFIGLNNKIISEKTWFNTFISVLKKIPGLDVLINVMPNPGKKNKK